MSYTLSFNSEAEKEYIVAYLWYEEQQIGLGERFLKDTEKQLQKITDNLLAYHFSKGKFRESSIRQFSVYNSIYFK